MVLLDSKPCRRRLTIFHLSLFEFQIAFHVIYLFRCWQFILSSHSFLHVLEEMRNVELIINNFFFIISLFQLKFLLKIINFLLFLVKNFIFLFFSSGILFLQIAINFSNVLLISIHHSFHFICVLFKLFELNIILLNAVLEAFAGFCQRKV